MITEWKKKLFTGAHKEVSPLEFGMTQADVMMLFGKPDNISAQVPPLILKYGEIELHFDKQNNHLFLIYSDEAEYLSILYETKLYDELEALSLELSNNNEVYCRYLQRDISCFWHINQVAEHREALLTRLCTSI